VARLIGICCKLIREVQRNPFEGTGQPEALKYDLSAVGRAVLIKNIV
jgi:Txe/YoeB family toxin of Txe-Axe toxin-antitoxin module